MEDDNTKFVLCYQNRTEDDILLKKDLDDLARDYHDRLTIVYYLSKYSTDKSDGYKCGYITREEICTSFARNQCPYTCICGPSGFNKCITDLLVRNIYD